jgi:hypothetical protein
MDGPPASDAAPSLAPSGAILTELHGAHPAGVRHEVWWGLSNDYVLVVVGRMGELSARLRVLPVAAAPAWILGSPEVVLATFLAGSLCAVDLGDWTDRVCDVWREAFSLSDEEFDAASWEEVAYQLDDRARSDPAIAAQLVAAVGGRADYAEDVRTLCIARCYPIPSLAARTTDEAPP